MWLRYRREADNARRHEYAACIGNITGPTDRPVIRAAADELIRAFHALAAGETSRSSPDPIAIRLGTRADDPAIAALVGAESVAAAGTDGFVLKYGLDRGHATVAVTGPTDAGILHGAFALARRMQLGEPLEGTDITDSPAIALRIANHWDNPSPPPGQPGVERGYAGGSIFDWEDLPGRVDPRLRDYGRLLASLGLNGSVVNNVNTAKRGLQGWRLLSSDWLPKVAALADTLRPYGIRLYLSVNFFSPILVGNLPTADPLDPQVRRWWAAKCDEIYEAVPDFGGFLVKADSEGEPGPYRYGRTHADGANMLAAALAPHGGTVFWRAFVYTHGADRVCDAYENFRPLDGSFAENVFVQIKNGPLDFQIREPVSPLLGAMPRTNQALELQITQEYTGQAAHVCFLAPQWREVLDFDTRAAGPRSTVAALLAGTAHPQRRGAIAGVMNLGSDRNWTGHDLAQANTYAFGRLAWNPQLTPEAIAYDWVRLTFSRDPEVVATISRILLDSRGAFEGYTSPLGLGLLAAKGNHFDPDPAGRADYHHADHDGIGYDRTAATGSGFTVQYPEPWRSIYESPSTCPEDLLLFFHHLPYGWRMRDGLRLIDEIHHRQDAGVRRAEEFVGEWDGLRGRIDDERFENVRARLVHQVELAKAWRESVRTYLASLRQKSARSTGRAAP